MGFVPDNLNLEASDPELAEDDQLDYSYSGDDEDP